MKTNVGHYFANVAKDGLCSKLVLWRHANLMTSSSPILVARTNWQKVDIH